MPFESNLPPRTFCCTDGKSLPSLQPSVKIFLITHSCHLTLQPNFSMTVFCVTQPSTNFFHNITRIQTANLVLLQGNENSVCIFSLLRFIISMIYNLQLWYTCLICDSLVCYPLSFWASLGNSIMWLQYTSWQLWFSHLATRGHPFGLA